MSGVRSELTIDQLAQRTGMSARNIRAHQSRGLLDPPTLRGRTGFYNDEHIARIRLIQRLQADGYSLELIRRLLRAAGDSTENVLRLAEALHAPFGDERPRIVELPDLQRRFRSKARQPLDRAQQIGLLRALDDGRYVEVTPQAWRGAEMFAELGVPVDELLEVGAEVRKHTDAIATAFVRLFLDKVWRPFEEAGHPEEGLDEVVQKLERLRPMTSAVVLSMFQMSMGDAASRSGAELERLGRRRR